MADRDDKETLRRVYQRQMDDWRRDHANAVNRRTTAGDLLVKVQAEYFEAHGEASVLEGKMAALRELAERDGVELR